jgi:hypothetical protein
MFTRLNKQGVESTKGFVVQSVSRFVIEYREIDKVIRLSVDRGLQVNGKACVYIYLDEFEKWSDGTPISTSRRKEILQNFKDAMKFQDVDVLTD